MSLENDLLTTMEIPKELLEYLPFLIEDLWELGSTPKIILRLLRELKIKSGKIKVLELGCGKGGIIVRIAKELGWQVCGIDGMSKFLEYAQKKAQEFKVADLCHFELEDIRDAVKNKRDFDVVILASVGFIFGDVRATIREIRKTIKTGGYIVIDDGFLRKTTHFDYPGYSNYQTYEKTIKELQFFGDKIIKEEKLAVKQMRSINKKYMQVITKQARTLEKEHPELNKGLKKYLDEQAYVCGMINEYFGGAVWILRKG
jgi:cyclopropane fatty-acyl-phospholipid synthase-like methyltransferase